MCTLSVSSNCVIDFTRILNIFIILLEKSARKLMKSKCIVENCKTIMINLNLLSSISLERQPLLEILQPFKVIYTSQVL